MSEDEGLRTNAEVDWTDMTKQDVAAWAVGTMRQHLLEFCAQLQRHGHDVVTVEGLRRYLYSLDASIEERTEHGTSGPFGSADHDV